MRRPLPAPAAKFGQLQLLRRVDLIPLGDVIKMAAIAAPQSVILPWSTFFLSHSL